MLINKLNLKLPLKDVKNISPRKDRKASPRKENKALSPRKEGRASPRKEGKASPRKEGKVSPRKELIKATPRKGLLIFTHNHMDESGLHETAMATRPSHREKHSSPKEPRSNHIPLKRSDKQYQSHMNLQKHLGLKKSELAN